MIRALPDKQCSSDPIPTWLLKTNVDLLAPFLCHLFCHSLEHSVVLSRMKVPYITPIVKKADMDPNETKSYRPISNLSVLSKLLERLVCKQLMSYLQDNRLLPDMQSAFRAHHSTETAVLKVLSDILLALDSGNLALLTLLDLSAAFHSVDHTTLLRQLQKSYGLSGTVLSWFTSYLTARTQYISHLLQPICSIVWRATGFGPWTDPVCSIYCRCTPACERPWSCASRLCRRHSDSRHLPSFGD